MTSFHFDSVFQSLTGHASFPWQKRLHERFVSESEDQLRFPPCSLPTGLGKTSVMAVWLLALAATADDTASRGRVPRRLVYVVNRRTIVDQATREAEKLRANLEKPELCGMREILVRLRGADAGMSADTDDAPPLAISTLRGQFADNGEWAADPARPAIIVGTVDMIGSRLLFSGYGVGRNRKPMHAGFLGQDTLLVHDEAHLEPAFQKLLDIIRQEQIEGRCPDFRPLVVMPLTATPRTVGGEKPFKLEKEDFDHRVIKQRLEAVKSIKLHPLDDEKKSAEIVAELAIKRAESAPGAAILVFVREVKDVKRVAEALVKTKVAAQKIVQLTGTLRGLERDNLVKTPVFQRYLPLSTRESTVAPETGTVFLVCTSAGEVGVDISADHLVCDLTTFESMAQRFGRVNRYGDPPNDAKIDVVYPNEISDSGPDKEFQTRRKQTLDLLKRLRGDGSPKAIAELPLRDRIAAFSPTPEVLPATDILFDAWALTSIRDKLPGRPPVADWLHGVAEWEPPETQVAWREEVQWINRSLWEEHQPEDLLEVYPLKPHEILKDRSKRVFEGLQQIAKRFEGSERSEIPVWIEDDRGVEPTTLQKIVDGDENAIANRTVILPPFVGGLSGGLLDGKSDSADDVADQWLDEDKNQRRTRVWDGAATPPRMRPARPAIDLDPDAGEFDDEPAAEEQGTAEETPSELPMRSIPRPPGRMWKWYARPRSADDDGSRAVNKSVELEVHTNDVANNVRRMVGALDLAETPEGRALVFAAEWHDAGKSRKVWQQSIWNAKYPKLTLAKSGNRRPPRDLSAYRHEFGSLLDVLSTNPERQRAGQRPHAQARKALNTLTPAERELALHFIAAHHGRARPHFSESEAFDPEHPSVRAAEVSQEIPRRFARLQRTYGRWGLAYLESILRAADAVASANPSETVKEDAEEATEAAAIGGMR